MFYNMLDLFYKNFFFGMAKDKSHSLVNLVYYLQLIATQSFSSEIKSVTIYEHHTKNIQKYILRKDVKLIKLYRRTMKEI